MGDILLSNKIQNRLENRKNTFKGSYIKIIKLKFE